MTCGCWIINLIDYYVDKRIILCIFRWKTRVVAISVSLIDGTHFLFRRDVNSINIQIFNNSTSKIFFCKFPWRFFILWEIYKDFFTFYTLDWRQILVGRYRLLYSKKIALCIYLNFKSTLMNF